MPYKPLVCKIRCNHPNRNSSRVKNRNHLVYIGTRPGTSLEPLKEELDNPKYLKYINERPLSHGLFGNLDPSEMADIIQLGNDLADLTKNKRNIYRGVVSLCPEDANRLEFTNKEAWNTYFKNTMPDIATQFNIPIQDFKWVGAYHHKKSNPHAHFMFWSDKQMVQDQYIHISKQHKCRELFSKEMFREERNIAILEKTAQRDLLLEKENALLNEQKQHLLFNKVPGLIPSDQLTEINSRFYDLAELLEKENRFAYKYLSSEGKDSVNALVNQILKIPDFRREYIAYSKYAKESVIAISPGESKRDHMINKADQDLKNRLANKVIKSCKDIILNKELLINNVDNLQLSHYDNKITDYIIDLPYIDKDTDFDFLDQVYDDSIENDTFCCRWSPEYKKAMQLLYADDKDKNIDRILYLLKKEAKSNNVLAFSELGKIYNKGILVEENKELALSLNEKAFEGFFALKDSNEKMKGYFYYRIGKMLESGTGTEQDYESAIDYYKTAVNEQNKYAKYSLANMYLRENGIELTEENSDFYKNESYRLLQSSADDDFSYACYKLAQISEQENRLNLSEDKINTYYKKAFESFKSSKDVSDDIEYKLGVMYYKGKGTEKNIDLAVEHFSKAIELKNENAKLMICNILLDKESSHYDEEKALKYLQELSEKDNYISSHAQYKLGMLHADIESKYFDLNKAIHFLESAVAQENNLALFQLGKLYSNPDLEIYDLDKAINYLMRSSALGNKIADYQLGKIYTNVESPYCNIEKGIEYLRSAAQSQNDFAMYRLGKVLFMHHQDINRLNKSIYFLNESSKNGNEHADYLLGVIYSDKKLSVYDIHKSIHFFEKSIEKGNAYAMEKLGNIYLWGSHPGVPKNIEKGISLLERAIENGNEHAQESLNFYRNFKEQMVLSACHSMVNRLFSSLVENKKEQYFNKISVKSNKKSMSKEKKKILAKGNYVAKDNEKTQ